LSNNLTFFVYPSTSGRLITPKINRVFFRDYNTNNFTEYLGVNESLLITSLESIKSSQNEKDCVCNNFLEEV